ncbi:MAG TPA: thymidine kinase [Tissierellia bacterium]|nr:thymidine kinase [Tissierellia bacterium]
MAKLYFRYGAMNSGKTTALMQVAYNYEERGMNVLLMKPGIDTKGADLLVSRLGVTRKVDRLIGSDDDVVNCVKEALEEKPIHCILVDEAQFFTQRQIDGLFDIVLNLDIPVICYGLRTDFLMNGFPGSTRLLLLAHSIEELKTICRCGKKAVINGRKVSGKYVFSGEQVAIEDGGDVTYESLCGQCYTRLREEASRC